MLALDIYIPENSELIEESKRSGGIDLPNGRYSIVDQPSKTFVGQITRQAWKIPNTDNASAILDAIKRAYGRQGFETHFECFSDGCGGFDFRYGIETSPPPDFQVNLQEFFYADLRIGDEIVTLLISSIDENVYLQQIHIVTENKDVGLANKGTIAASLKGDANRWIIKGAEFEAGAATLISIPQEEFTKIAERLKNNPQETCYIVGHSDQSGSLEGNQRLSRARANSVRDILIRDFDVSSNQIYADGVGFLAPIADNTSEDGRNANRRVEAVFLVN